MLKAGAVLDFGPLGMTFHVKKTASDTGGRSLEMEWELAPGTGGTPVHIHPQATESYAVLDGELGVFVGGAWRTLSAGESVSVSPGQPHTFRNAGSRVTRVYNVHQPAMQFGEYFGGLAKIANGGTITSARMTPGAILHLAVLMTSYPREIRSVQPPHALVRVLGAVGRLFDYRL